MYKSIRIKNFRGFTDLSIKSMAKVNLFAGSNNIGKTAVLEALWIHNAPSVPDTAFRVNAFRGLTAIDRNRLLLELFTNLDSDKQVSITTTGDWSKRSRTLKIRLEDRGTSFVPLSAPGENQEIHGEAPDRTSRQEIIYEYTSETGTKVISRGYFVETNVGPGVIGEGFRTEREATIPGYKPGTFLAARQPWGQAAEIQRLSAMTERKQDTDVVRLLQIIDPRIVGLSILTRANIPTIYVDVGERHLLPAALLGDGTLRLITIALAIGEAQGGIVLIDEIENGLYYQVMERVWESIGEMAESLNVQLFATTHSEECLRAAHKAFSRRKQYDFCLHRLERMKDGHRAVSFDQEMLETAIESGLETR